MNLEQLDIKMIKHKIQCSQFGRSTVLTAKQMSFESGFKRG